MVKLNDLKKPAPCKFCNQKEDGGVEILRNDIDLGELGKIETGVTLWNYSQNFEPHLDLWAWFDGEENTGHSIGEPHIDIKYCPFCGKRIQRPLKSYDGAPELEDYDE